VIPGDIEAIAAQVGTAFDAILSWRFLARFDLLIDYAAGKLDLAGG